jgi:hypothetical protein
MPRGKRTNAATAISATVSPKHFPVPQHVNRKCSRYLLSAFRMSAAHHAMSGDELFEPVAVHPGGAVFACAGLSCSDTSSFVFA